MLEDLDDTWDVWSNADILSEAHDVTADSFEFVSLACLHCHTGMQRELRLVAGTASFPVLLIEIRRGLEGE